MIEYEEFIRTQSGHESRGTAIYRRRVDRPSLHDRPLPKVPVASMRGTELPVQLWWTIDPAHDLRLEFAELADRWRRETGHLSIAARAAMHPAYQSIISKGNRVLPLILDDLKRHGGDWFWALHIITGESPVDESDAGDIQAMTDAWLNWGVRNHYISSAA